MSSAICLTEVTVNTGFVMVFTLFCCSLFICASTVALPWKQLYAEIILCQCTLCCKPFTAQMLTKNIDISRLNKRQLDSCNKKSD